MPTVEDLTFRQVPDLENKCSNLTIIVNKKGWIIKGITLQNEELFAPTGVSASFAMESSNTIKVPLRCDKNQTYSLEMKLILGQGLDSNNFTVISVKQLDIKKFCMFMTVGAGEKDNV